MNTYNRQFESWKPMNNVAYPSEPNILELIDQAKEMNDKELARECSLISRLNLTIGLISKKGNAYGRLILEAKNND